MAPPAPPTIYARSQADVRTVVLPALVDPPTMPLPAVTVRVADHAARARRAEACRERLLLSLGLASAVVMTSLALYVWGWTP